MNEEKGIKQAVEAFKIQNYEALEVIVVANNCSDKTFQVSQKCANKALNFNEAIGVCKARNEGVKSATGEVFIFIDADSRLEKEAVLKIANQTKENIFGSTLGRGDNNSLRGKFFFFYKNWTHRLKIYSGVVDGVFFCHRKIFEKVNGFDESKKIAEFEDIIKRMKSVGGKYKLMKDCYAIVSLRRYEEKGYLKTHLFWLKWKIVSFFKKDNKLAGQYFGQAKNKK